MLVISKLHYKINYNDNDNDRSNTISELTSKFNTLQSRANQEKDHHAKEVKNLTNRLKSVTEVKEQLETTVADTTPSIWTVSLSWRPRRQSEIVSPNKSKT